MRTVIDSYAFFPQPIRGSQNCQLPVALKAPLAWRPIHLKAVGWLVARLEINAGQLKCELINPAKATAALE